MKSTNHSTEAKKHEAAAQAHREAARLAGALADQIDADHRTPYKADRKAAHDAQRRAIQASAKTEAPGACTIQATTMRDSETGLVVWRTEQARHERMAAIHADAAAWHRARS